MWTSHRSRLDSTKWPLNFPVIVGSAVPVQEGPIQGRAQWRSGYGPRLARPGPHMGTGSSPCSPASHPAPCLWPGKAFADGPRLWDPAPGLASDRHSIGRCTHLGSESLDGRSSSLSLLSVYLPFQ